MKSVSELIGKLVLASFGACDVIIKVTTPIILIILWIRLMEVTDWSSYLFVIVGIFSSLFRASKFIFDIWNYKNE